jgi:hypothetical protein
MIFVNNPTGSGTLKKSSIQKEFFVRALSLLYQKALTVDFGLKKAWQRQNRENSGLIAALIFESLVLFLLSQNMPIT